MIDIIYADWLKIAPFIYLILAVISFYAITPKGDLYRNYRVGKNIFGALLLFMGAYIAALGLFDFRTNDFILAQSLNISSFFAVTNVAGYMLQVLLGRPPQLKVTLSRIGLCWLALSVALLANYIFMPHSLQFYAVIALSLVLIGEVVRMTIAFFKIYRRVQDKSDEYYSDNVQPFINWMKIGLYALLMIGFFGCTHAYFPAVVNLIYGILAVGVVTYIVIAFRNYIVTISHVFHAFDSDGGEQDDDNQHSVPNTAPVPSQNVSSEILHSTVERWIAAKGFVKAGITAQDLSEYFQSNRTYLATYIRNHYNLTFREWIAALRIAYAKELLIENPDLSVSDVADAVGYNRTSFVKIFSRECGLTPLQWRQSGGTTRIE